MDRIPICCAWHPEFKYFKHIAKLRDSLFDTETSGIRFVLVENAPSFFRINQDQYKGKPLFSNFTDWNNQFNQDISQ